MPTNEPTSCHTAAISTEQLPAFRTVKSVYHNQHLKQEQSETLTNRVNLPSSARYLQHAVSLDCEQTAVYVQSRPVYYRGTTSQPDAGISGVCSRATYCDVFEAMFCYFPPFRSCRYRIYPLLVVCAMDGMVGSRYPVRTSCFLNKEISSF